ncbi:MAG: ABC transporter substrate-binding protein, partial [Candidatus Eremiobacteraeota bacterium]|nr:ABC transporter substrate-binding protein [Candidatus Eremiobacteraeota bacterium]
MKIKRRDILATLAAASAAASLQPSALAADDAVFGVSGPFSGDNANYGRVWKNAMNLAADEINGAGGLRGRKVALIYADTQSDPKQSVAVAQQFAGDSKIVAELGDFASPASMAASPIYERAKMVQFGFTNSDPNFTKGGEYMWSTAVTLQTDAALLATTAYRRLGKRHALIYRDTDWGKASRDIYVAKLQALGGSLVATENYLVDDKDYRSILAKIRAANPDVVSLFSYYTDGALLMQQAKDVGLVAKFAASGSCYNAQFLKLGGDAVDGVIMAVLFFVRDPRPDVQRFVAAYTKRYNEDPDQYAARAYDALKIIAWAAEHGNFTRTGVRDALATGKNIPSILYGP